MQYWKAVGRAMVGLPAGALVNAFGAVVLGAPIRIQYLTRTLHWSLLMSLFTVVPAASVLGSSWMDWQRLFANSKPRGVLEYMICLPAHGAVIGAWFGAWPMPLDWERPWQEWPICVTYGAVVGYSLGMLASLGSGGLLIKDRLLHVCSHLGINRFSFGSQYEVVEAPLIIGIYGFFRRDPQHCSYWKAVGRAMVGLPAGALVNAFGAVVLGAPIRIQYLTRTLYWSLLMSLFTVVPAASVLGSSWMDWQRLFANSKPRGVLEYMICLPAHGAVIGAWFGAWPMPLDWERPWQEWPICVTYGAVVGYSLGMLASLVCTFVQNGRHHVKGD
ncbi:hypothetical protein QJS04_geneDACA018966 [Acorus gramineus]|uniref:Phosphatidylinositol-glycan biosynthesis class F protein n=1 Tax=Acorus gramineus TaxID=55184 RepID=A0AAV9AEA1_ACOGR|nr:hypothetical protein QJS04_geneDACA018966 [Acorus gramineus]